MTILEMKDKRGLLLDENKDALATAKKEMRKLNDAELKSFNDNVAAIEQLNTDIEKAQKELRNNNIVIITKNTNKVMNTNFNLLTAIRQRAEGRVFDERTLAVIDAGKAEMRKSGINPEGDIILPTEYRADILAGTDTAGKEIVGEDKLGILKPLRASLVLVKAGATYLTGLVGDVSIPVYAGTTAAWKGEVAAADDGGGAFSEVTLAPKRLTAYIDISKQFLAQDSISAEAMLKQDIVLAIAAKLEATILGKENVSATQPLGLFYTAPSINGTATWANMVALESAVDTSNALFGNLSYITNAAGRGKLKTIERTSGNGMYLMEGNEMNGYPVYVSNHVATDLQVGGTEEGIIFANWNDLVIAQWGGIDLIVDPYSQATTGQVRIVVNAYFDAKFRRSVSYKTGSMLP